MERRPFLFLAGLHRSGTTLLHAILRDHPDISGFRDTGVNRDEGQFLQTVYPPASVFGGPGRFAFDDRTHMDETHPLATARNADRIFSEWRTHLDLSRRWYLEKSPPNVTKTRFLQKLFPGSVFLIIVRHPIAVSYATQKWSGTSISALLAHWFRAHDIVLGDLKHLHSAYLLNYERFVTAPQSSINGICAWLGVEPIKLSHTVRSDINAGYFKRWEEDSRNSAPASVAALINEYEDRARYFGYSLRACDWNPVPTWMGESGA